jgi:hypothetical protein
MIKIFKKNKKVFVGLFILFIFLLAFTHFSNFASADFPGGELNPGAVAQENKDESEALNWFQKKIFLAFAWLAYIFIYFVGLIFILLNKTLISVAQYNNFVNLETVEIGWKIVRDLCNMFFILALLMIAFATVLRYENYSMKKLLPKLLIMAVLINFSKTICGIFIDFSQIIMLTFMKAISTGGNNLVHLLGMDKMINMEKQLSNNVNIDLLPMIAGLLTAIAAALIAVVIVIAFLAILLMRIIMLWIYVILSPIAFLTSALPAGQKYATQWWGEFSRQLVVGPVLAFFLWLALFTAGKSANNMQTELEAMAGTGASDFHSAILSDLLVESTFNTYLITVALLLGGLIVTQQAGGAAASVAGNALGKIRGGAKWTGGKALGGAKGAGRIGLATAKGADAKYLGGWGASRVQNIKDQKGLAAAGAIAGTFLMPGFGTAGGALVTSYLGKKFFSNRDKNKQRRKEVMSGEFTNEKGETYKEHGGEFLKYNKGTGKFIGPDKEDTEDASLAVRHEKVKPMSEGMKTYLAGYYSVTSPADAAKSAVVDEKVSKLEANYKSFDSGTLKRLLEIEKDSAKKMAIAMTLAIKSGFKDAKEVNKAKEYLSNPIAKGRFNDIMNKRQMVINNTLPDGEKLNEGEIAKLVSEGKANWHDQDPTKMNEAAFSLMARQTEDNFDKAIEKMIKTDKDKSHVINNLKNSFKTGTGMDDNDRALRRAYAQTSGDYSKPYENDFAGLKHDIKSMNAADFTTIKLETTADPNFSRAFKESIDISKLRSIYRNDKINSEIKESLMKTAASNSDLAEKMKNVPDFQEYV